MSIWGTLIGGMLGFTIGGPIGALLGSFLGSKFSGGKVKSINFSNENSQQIFALALIILSAKISKADGVVTKDELLAIKEKTMPFKSVTKEICELAGFELSPK